MDKAILVQFLIWYIFDVPKEIIRGWGNYLAFNLNYFSVLILIKTYFSHWHKYRFSYGKKLDPGKYIEAFVGNMMSRFIGMILRTFIIIFGVLSEFFTFVFGAIILIGWFLLPIFLFMGLIIGLRLLI